MPTVDFTSGVDIVVYICTETAVNSSSTILVVNNTYDRHFVDFVLLRLTNI